MLLSPRNTLSQEIFKEYNKVKLYNEIEEGICIRIKKIDWEKIFKKTLKERDKNSVLN